MRYGKLALNGLQAVPGAALAVILWVAEAAPQERASSSGQDRASEAIWFDGIVHWTVRAIELVGIATIVIGAVGAFAVYFHRIVKVGLSEKQYHSLRASLGRSILLGLEFLVAADIINTVAIDPTLESVAVLAAIVVVRTFLSFALEVEIDGKWPWRKGGG